MLDRLQMLHFVVPRTALARNVYLAIETDTTGNAALQAMMFVAGVIDLDPFPDIICKSIPFFDEICKVEHVTI